MRLLAAAAAAAAIAIAIFAVFAAPALAAGNKVVVLVVPDPAPTGSVVAISACGIDPGTNGFMETDGPRQPDGSSYYALIGPATADATGCISGINTVDGPGTYFVSVFLYRPGQATRYYLAAQQTFTVV